MYMHCVENKKDGQVSINVSKKNFSGGLYLSSVPAFFDRSTIMNVCKNGNWPDEKDKKYSMYFSAIHVLLPRLLKNSLYPNFIPILS